VTQIAEGPRPGAGMVPPEVTAFVAQVRVALDDLPDEDVEDLTGGLEADLAETWSDGASLLGDPTAYAEELRVAAGLPGRAAPVERPLVVVRAFIRWRGRMDRLSAWAAAHGAPEIYQELRPAWWLLRGWLGYQLLAGILGIGFGEVLPANFPRLILFLACLVGSLWFGRRYRAAQGRMRKLLIVGTWVTGLVLFPAGAAVRASDAQYQYEQTSTGSNSSSDDFGDGIWANHQWVKNVFAYDGAGHLITGVRLYDQDGRALQIADLKGATDESDPSLAPGCARVDLWDSGGTDLSPTTCPASDAFGAKYWNVYPLTAISGVPGEKTVQPPFALRPPLSVPAPTPMVTTTATGSSAPTATAGADPNDGASSAVAATSSPTGSR
jgi:hypothetical protein